MILKPIERKQGILANITPIRNRTPIINIGPVAHIQGPIRNIGPVAHTQGHTGGFIPPVAHTQGPIRRKNPMWPQIPDRAYNIEPIAHIQGRPILGSIKKNTIMPYSGRNMNQVFQGFGADITNDTMLVAGNEYTITYSSGALFQPSESTVLNGVRERFLEGTITKVVRPLFSGRYAITFIPSISHPLSYWLETLTAIWGDMGYLDAAYVSTDAGPVSTQGGGAAQASVEVIKKTGDVASKAVGAVAEGAGKAVGAAFKGVSSGLGMPLMLGIIGIGGLYLYISTRGLEIPKFKKG